MADRNLRGVTAGQAAHLLERLTEDHLLNNPNGVLKSEDSIQAFGAYTITKHSQGFKIYKNKVAVSEISSAKNALAWCIADKYSIADLKRKISDLDMQMSRRHAEIACLKHVINSNIDTERKFIIEDKLQDSLYKAKQTKNQLDKCINRAKYYQLKGFENETSRLGIKTSSRNISKGI